MNKSPKIWWNIFGDSVIQSLRSGKTQKSGLVPMSRQEKLADLFLLDLKYDQKRPRNEAFGHFLVNFIKRLPWKHDRYKNLDFSFGYVVPSSVSVESFIAIKRQEKKLSMIKTFKFFVSDHLEV